MSTATPCLPFLGQLGTCGEKGSPVSAGKVMGLILNNTQGLCLCRVCFAFLSSVARVGSSP